MTMTAQEVIKKFMATLDLQNYSDATAALDDAVKSISRFDGIQDALNTFLEERKTLERQAIQTILGDDYKSDYDGLQLIDLLKLAETDAELSAALDKAAYYSYGRPTRISAEERIRLQTADLFLEKCGIVLPRYVYRAFNSETQTMMATYSTNYYYPNAENPNVDTGAITGSDAGGSTAKDSDTVVPEIGNKYTATSSRPQNISTGTNDWIVAAADYGDTITSGGADSINAGGGWDVIYVEGNNATVHTGADDKAADTVVIRSDVKIVTISDLEEWDALNIEGDFSVLIATLNSNAATVIDKTGRTIVIENWTTAKNATLTLNSNSQKIGEWLQDFIDYEDTSTGETISADTSEPSPVNVNLANVTGLSGSFNAAGSARNATYSETSTSGNVGTISTEFPDVSTFTARGLTVELLGRASSKNSSVTKLTLSRLSDDEKVVFAGLYKWWIKEGLKLNEESFGLGFTTEGVVSNTIQVYFYTAANDDELAAVINSGGRDLKLRVNMAHFSGISETDSNGSGNVVLLDRTLAHELNHATFAANISNFNSLPQFFTEGVAELVHGVDDERVTRIWDLAAGTTTDNNTNTTRIDTTFSLSSGTGDDDAYAGGYMFLRWLAKTAAAQSSTPALGDITVAVNLTVDDATYYANLTNASAVETATTTKSDTNYAVGTANDLTYTPAAGIKQNISSTNDNWAFKEIGSYNSIRAGSGNDSVTIVGASGNFNVGNGDNFVSISGGSKNTVTAGSGDDSLSILYGYSNLANLGAGNNYASLSDGSFQDTVITGGGNDTLLIGGHRHSIQTGAGNDSIALLDFGSGNQTLVTNNSVDAGAGDDIIHVNGVYNYVNAGAGADQIYIYSSNHTVAGGADSDIFYLSSSSVENVHIADFSLSQNDILYVGFRVNSSSVSQNSFTLNSTKVYLDNAENLSDFLDMTVYHNSTTASTTLKNLLGVDSFDWSAGTYRFQVENNAVDIYSDALYYNQTQSGKTYATVTVDSNKNLTISASSGVTITLTPPDTNYYSLTLGNYSYSFRGTAQFRSNLAYSGTFNLSDHIYTYDGKTLEYDGTGSVTVVLDGGLTVSDFVVGDTVSIIDDTESAVYSVSNGKILKEVTPISGGTSATVTTYQANYTVEDITNAEFSELNRYVAGTGSINLLSGSITKGSHEFEIVYADNGITLIYDSTGTNFVGVSNFDAGESLRIDGEIYTNVSGQIHNSSGKVYNGDWGELVSNLNESSYWGETDGWSISSGTAVYSLNGTAVITVSGLAANATLADVSLNGSLVTISAHGLNSENTVTVSSGYTLALANNVTQPQSQVLRWTVSGGTAIYSAATTAGYICDGTTISYQDEKAGTPQITITGLSSNARATNFSLNGTTVTVSANALDSSQTAEISSGYTLALGSNVAKPQPQSESWSVSNGTATYATKTSAGYILTDNNTKISYQEEVPDAAQITITGLSANATTSNISLDNTTVTVTANALDSSKKVQINSGYTLALGNNVTQPQNQGASWSVTNGTATYATKTSAGYVTTGSTIEYQAEKTNPAQITINGLSSNATTADISLLGTTVTVATHGLDTSKTVTITDGYTLALATGVPQAQTQNATWTFTNGTATYSATTTAGYVINANGNISYQAAHANDALITITGLRTTTTEDDIGLNGRTVVVTAAALVQGKTVRISGDGYTLALADDVKQPEVLASYWKVTNGTAIYSARKSAGYVTDGETITYQGITEGDTLITILNLSTDAQPENFSLKGTVVTVSDHALNTDKVVEISEGYTLALGSNVTQPKTQSATWTVSSGTAVYSTATTAGYVCDGTTISYQEANSGRAQITIEGLSSKAASKNFTLNSRTVSVTANALDTSKTVTISDGYYLALGSDVKISKATEGAWEVSSGTATYSSAGISAGYAVANNEIIYITASTGAQSVTVTGLKSTATAKDISLNDKTVSLKAAAVQGEVTITNGYALNLLKGTYSHSTVKGGNGVDTITNNGNGLVISTGTGNDLITLANGTSKNTINAGTGNDYISATKGKNLYQYATGDGDDTIFGFTTNDTLQITNGKIDSWKVDGTDLIFTVGRGTITIKDGAGIKIFTAIGNEKAVANVYGDAIIYNDKKTSATISSTFSGTYTAESSIISIDATAANSTEIVANAKANKIYGGTGADIIDGGKGNDTIYGGAGNDYIFGGDGNDKLYGDAGADTLSGGKGNDTLTGGYGADLYIYTAGNDVIADYTEEDKISIASGTVSSISSTNNDVVLKIGNGKLTLKDALNKKITIDDETRIYEKGKIYDVNKTAVTVTAAGTLASNLVNVDASALTSSFQYSAGASNNLLIGGKGADTFTGGAGNDTIYGNAGSDRIYGDAGNDVLDGGAGTDLIEGGAGDDLIDGGAGNDTLNGGTGNNTITGGAGNDLFIYGGGNDTITDYETGKDKIKITEEILGASIKGADVILKTESGSITIQNGSGKKITTLDEKNKSTNYIYAAGVKYNEKQTAVTLTADFSGRYAADTGIVSIDATAANAVQIVGSAKANKIYGGDGKDTINGDAGNDSIYGGDGADSLIGGAGNDKIWGEDGNDYLSGGDGNDTLWGGNGNDKLYGDAGNDKLYGGDGDDSLWGGLGNDTLWGGDGADVFIYEKETGNDVIADYTDEDKITISGATVSSIKVSGKDIVLNIGENTLKVKNRTGEKITVNGVTRIYEKGKTYDGDRTWGIFTVAVTETLASSMVSVNASLAGASKIVANANDNSIRCGAKNDTIYGGEGRDTIWGNGGNDLLYGEYGNDSLFGGDGNDTLYGGAGRDTLFGEAGNDYLYGGDGVDFIEGGDGNDLIYGEDGDDSLNGGAGNDTLYGGIGKNTLVGGDGNDIFVCEGGDDYIDDYTAGEDKIKFSSEIVSEAISGPNVILRTANGGIVTIRKGLGQEITMIDAEGNTTKKTYTNSIAKTLDLMYDDNFVTDDFSLDDISEQKFAVQNIETQNYSKLDEQPLLTFAKDK